jgi:hypothetical protein
MRWTEHIACMGAMRNSYRTLVRTFEGERPLERLGVNGRIIRIKIYIKEICNRSVDWIQVA